MTFADIKTSLQKASQTAWSQIGVFLESDSSESDCRQDTKAQVKKTLEIFNTVFEQHRFDELAMSFNGGKDCLVMLVLFLGALHVYSQDHPEYLGTAQTIPAIYVHYENSFAEVDDFVEDCNHTYALDTHKTPGPMISGLAQYLDGHPKVKAIIVGIRRADPYGETLDYIQPTDHGWPDFLRVHPVLDWHYVEIWDFLRCLKIPYCPLYDQGYTSLGSTTNTTQNPILKLTSDSNTKSRYRPAYELLEDNQERLGRNVDTTPQKQQ